MPKRRQAVWPFAAISILLMLLPSGVSQRARLVVLGGFGPVRNLANAAHGLAQRGWEAVHAKGHTDNIERQNEFLRSQVVQLHARTTELTAKLDAAMSTRSVVSDRDFELLPADVILNLDSSSYRSTLVIQCGSRDGVEPGMTVLYHGHVIGRILEAAPWTARVMLTTDPAFRARAVSVPRTAEGPLSSERHVGVFSGTGGEEALLKWLSDDATVEEGAYVVTTEDPLNRIPKGLILGRVTGIDRTRGASPRVQVTPIIDPEGLEFVLILKPKP